MGKRLYIKILKIPSELECLLVDTFRNCFLILDAMKVLGKKVLMVT